MKRYLSIFVIAAMTMFAGCGESDDSSNREIVISDQSELSQTAYADEEATGGFSFVAQSDWTATVTENKAENRMVLFSEEGSTVSWLRLLYDGEEMYGGGAGAYTLSIELEANLTGETRTATIKIVCGETAITVIVTQQGTKKDGTIPDGSDDSDSDNDNDNDNDDDDDDDDGEQNYGGSGTFTYGLHGGLSFDFQVDGATFKDNYLHFYNEGQMVDFHAFFYLPEGSPLLEGQYNYSGSYDNTAADTFRASKGVINECYWYPAADKGVIEVSLDQDIYTIRYMLYISDGSNDGVHNGEIDGTYTGYLPTDRPE